MAFSPLRSKNHGRSLSLPLSDLQHPSIAQFNDNLSKISASSPTENTLNLLQNMYSNIDDLLALPHVQQVISQDQHKKWVVDRVVDAYIRLLDACTTAKDSVSQTKHDVQHLLSALRRKDANDIKTYRQASRRKTIRKALKELKKSLKSTKHDDLSLDNDQDTVAVVYMIKEAELVTITMFESLLSNVIGGNNVQAKQSSWSFLSKNLRASHQSQEMDPSEYLKEMESSIQILEQELECLFRQFIKTRVFLLNILNHY